MVGGESYSSSFNGAISLPVRLSFNTERNRAIWLGPDATLGNCDAVDHTHRMFTVFEVAGYVDFLSELTGLPREDYELISIAESLSVIAFLILRSHNLDACVICYVGDNQNVATWIRDRRPGNRVAKYFVRILNRLENERNFTAAPMYVSTLRNKLQDELSRLDKDKAIAHGVAPGLVYVDVGPTVREYIQKRMREFALVSPTGNEARLRVIMQYVEKRIVRHIPSRILKSMLICAFGIGSNRRYNITKHEKVACVGRGIIPWPSELSCNAEFAATNTHFPTQKGTTHACIGTVPHLELDRKFTLGWIVSTDPLVMVLDCHPQLIGYIGDFPWFRRNRRYWSWKMEASAYGGTKARSRIVLVSSRLSDKSADHMAPMFIFDVNLPTVLIEFLRQSGNPLDGFFTISTKLSVDINQPTPLGWISMKPDALVFGPKTNLGAIGAINGDSAAVANSRGESIKIDPIIMDS